MKLFQYIVIGVLVTLASAFAFFAFLGVLIYFFGPFTIPILLFAVIGGVIGAHMYEVRYK